MGEPKPSADEFQRRVVAFVRAFGLHRPDETPCGAPVAVSEAHALAVLQGHRSLTQTELARHLGLTKSTVSRLVDQLAERGWARRVSGTVDARCRVVELTPDGRRVAGQIARRRASKMADVLDSIPAAERSAVLAALDTLTEAAHAATQ